MSRNDQPFAPHGGDASPAPAPAREWIPIRSLGPRHRDRVLVHLLALDERSRYLRFGYMATTATSPVTSRTSISGSTKCSASSTGASS